MQAITEYYQVCVDWVEDHPHIMLWCFALLLIVALVS